MFIVRPSAVQVNAWSKLISDDTWSWDNLPSAMKKSETFTPPLSSIQSTAGMQYQTSSGGSDGPLQPTYPAYMVPITTNWLPTLNSPRIPTSPDVYNGINIGGFFATFAINPSNWTRSSAKASYYLARSMDCLYIGRGRK
ncbi:GMC oxidoreductase [Laccaria amethystina LaAM-08-1]|uniref:GMC oxidoreductase n=1 Tax=Laccaria amethystina LaAM-08-1 TaxID=1095629 RepID=A0A0C9WZP0_9AGAR|nr:GMC oxidoreductase [Laccaria amethystina LaAM-08-1]